MRMRAMMRSPWRWKHPIMLGNGYWLMARLLGGADPIPATRYPGQDKRVGGGVTADGIVAEPSLISQESRVLTLQCKAPPASARKS